MLDLAAQDLAEIREICVRYGDDPTNLLEILHDLQEFRGFIAEETLPVLADALNISRAEVHGVVSFYHDFRRAPAGKVVVRICRAEACQSVGAMRLIEAICLRRGARLGNTSAAGVTIEPVYCLGNCALAPAAMVGDRLHCRLDADRLDKLITEAGA